jgi:hypothetical protein
MGTTGSYPVSGLGSQRSATGSRPQNQIVPAWQNSRVEDVVADRPPATVYYVVRHAESNRVLVLFTDTHLGYLVPARLRDNPRLGVFGEISDGYLLTEPEPGKTRVVRRMRLRCGALALQRVRYCPSCWSGARPSRLWGEAVTARGTSCAGQETCRAEGLAEGGRASRGERCIVPSWRRQLADAAARHRRRMRGSDEPPGLQPPHRVPTAGRLVPVDQQPSQRAPHLFAAAAKRFGAVAALDECTFSSQPGRLTRFLDPNGASKTTARPTVSGLVELDASTVRWQGPNTASGTGTIPLPQCLRCRSARSAGAQASQPSVIASFKARLVTVRNWMSTAGYPSKCGIVKKALGFAASTASFSLRSSTRTARIGPAGGGASPNRLRSALLNGRTHAKAFPATDQVRLP